MLGAMLVGMAGAAATYGAAATPAYPFQGAGCLAHPAAATAKRRANNGKTKRLVRIRAIRPGSIEQGPINARYG
jgi:hypothetical protein